MLSPYWILWLDLYAIRKQISMMLYFPLSSHVHLVLYNPLCLGKHNFCSALPGEAPCADRQTLCSHPTKLPCILHRKTLVSWNNTIDKVCLLFHFPEDIFLLFRREGRSFLGIFRALWANWLARGTTLLRLLHHFPPSDSSTFKCQTGTI